MSDDRISLSELVANWSSDLETPKRLPKQWEDKVQVMEELINTILEAGYTFEEIKENYNKLKMLVESVGVLQGPATAKHTAKNRAIWKRIVHDAWDQAVRRIRPEKIMSIKNPSVTSAEAKIEEPQIQESAQEPINNVIPLIKVNEDDIDKQAAEWNRKYPNRTEKKIEPIKPEELLDRSVFGDLERPKFIVNEELEELIRINKANSDE